MFDATYVRLDEVYEAEERTASHPPQREPVVQPGFQLPRSIWQAMFACYATFFAAMAFLVDFQRLGMFMVVVSALYTAMYFGTASILAKLPRLPDLSPLDCGRPLETWCGSMDRNAVIGQVLVVPFGVAFFGVAIAIIAAWVA